MSIFRRRDAWRKHPVFQSTLKDTFPGLGRAFSVFLVYVGVDETYKFFNKPVERIPDLSRYHYQANADERQGPPTLVIDEDDHVAHH